MVRVCVPRRRGNEVNEYVLFMSGTTAATPVLEVTVQADTLADAIRTAEADPANQGRKVYLGQAKS
jgi:hypothetical protein